MLRNDDLRSKTLDLAHELEAAGFELRRTDLSRLEHKQ